MTQPPRQPTFAMRAFGRAHAAIAVGLVGLLLLNVAPNFDAIAREYPGLLTFIGVFVVYATGLSIKLARGWSPARPWHWLALSGPCVVLALTLGGPITNNLIRPQDPKGFGPSLWVALSMIAILVAGFTAFLDARAGRTGVAAGVTRDAALAAAAVGATVLGILIAVIGNVSASALLMVGGVGALIAIVAVVRARRQLDLGRTWGQLLSLAAAAGFAGALLSASCSTTSGSTAGGGGGASAPTPDLAVASAASTTTLAEGQLAALPSPAPFFIEISKASGAVAQGAHAPGFVYGLSGTTRVTAGDQTKDVRAGEATFIAADAPHAHAVTGTAESLFVTVRPTAGKTSDLHGGTPSYQSAELPSPPGGANREALLQVTLGPGGRSGAFKANGIVAYYVVEGQLELRSGTALPEKLTAGQGAFRLQGTNVNLVNTGSGSAKYLVFFLVPAEQTLQTEQPTSP